MHFWLLIRIPGQILSFLLGDSSFGATKIFHAFDIPYKLAPDQ